MPSPPSLHADLAATRCAVVLLLSLRAMHFDAHSGPNFALSGPPSQREKKREEGLEKQRKHNEEMAKLKAEKEKLNAVGWYI